MVDKEVPLIEANKTAQKDVKLDPGGFFVIEIDRKNKNIRVEYFSNIYKNDKIVSGDLQMVFHGKKANALCDTIARYVKALQPEHYMYLGRELQRAQEALGKNIDYAQDGC